MRNLNSLVLSALWFIAVSCNFEENNIKISESNTAVDSTIVTRYKDGVVKDSISVKIMYEEGVKKIIKDGVSKSFYPNQTLKSRIEYKRGAVVGTVTLVAPGGAVETGKYSLVKPISSDDSIVLREIYGNNFCPQEQKPVYVKSGFWIQKKEGRLIKEGYYMPFVMCKEVIDTVILNEIGDSTHVVVDYEIINIKDGLWNYYNVNGGLIKSEVYINGRRSTAKNIDGGVIQEK